MYSPTPPTDSRTRLSRYLLLGEIGRGAMGRVLRAYDPKLQREVALKEVLAPQLDAEATARLVAEARAMARLSHPNVVSVYDVEMTPSGSVVVAMEYVAGRTLRQWLDEGPAWVEVVERFVDAGRGLAAAHEAGILHRDFKPANVLVTDGAAKVTDFGLAKASSPSAHGPASELDSLDPLDSEGVRTEAGTVMGTPRYMAPEQHRGGKLSGATDQFAFCVALWEALCGEPPFSGAQLAVAKHRGPPPWPAASVPSRIAEAIRRGLAPRPADRWPSMSALLEALSDHRSRRRRTRWLLLGVGGVAAVAAVAIPWRVSAERCVDISHELADVWDDARRADVRRAVLATDKPYALPAWERIETNLDAYRDGWVRMRSEICEATGSQDRSTADLDLRMACLDRAALELRATVDTLIAADAQVVERTDHVLSGLPPISRCEDAEALAADVQPPLPRDASTVESIRAHLAEARAEADAGHYDRAQDVMDATRPALDSVDYGPIQTEFLLQEARVLALLGRYAEAEHGHRAAMEAAMHWGQLDALRSTVLGLVEVVGIAQQRVDAGYAYLRVAQGVARGDRRYESDLASYRGRLLRLEGNFDASESELRRALQWRVEALGPNDLSVASARNNLGGALHALGRFEEAEAEMEAALDLRVDVLGPNHPLVGNARNNLALVYSAQGKLEAAEQQHRRTLALYEAVLGADHPDAAVSRNNLGLILQRRGRYEEAEVEFRRAAAIIERALGPEHPMLPKVRMNLGNALSDQGKFAEAEAEYHLSMQRFEALVGPDHPEIALSRTGLGNLLQWQGRFAEAEAEHRRALQIRLAALGPDHPKTATSRNNLANAVFSQGRLEEALEIHEVGLAAAERGLGSQHPDVALALYNIGVILAAQGKRDAAETTYRRALAIQEASLPSSDVELARSRAALADVLLKRGAVAEALALAEQAWADAQGGSEPVRAELAFTLARALWSSNRQRDDRGRARSLAEQACRWFADAGPGRAEPAAQCERWIERHPISAKAMAPD